MKTQIVRWAVALAAAIVLVLAVTLSHPEVRQSWGVILFCAGLAGCMGYCITAWEQENIDYARKSRQYRLERANGTVRIETYELVPGLLRVRFYGSFDDGDACLAARTELAQFGLIAGDSAQWNRTVHDEGRSKLVREGEPARGRGWFSFYHLSYCEAAPARELLDKLVGDGTALVPSAHT